MIKKCISVLLSVVYPLLLVVVIGMVVFSPHPSGKVTFRAEELPTSPRYTVNLDKKTIDCFSSQTYHPHVFQAPVSYKWYQVGPYYRAVFYYPRNYSQTRTPVEQWSYKQPPSNHLRVGWNDSPTWAQTADQLTYCYTELLPASGLAHPLMPALLWSLCILSLLLGTWMIIHPRSVSAGLLWYRTSGASAKFSSEILPYLLRRVGVLLLGGALLLLHFLIFIFI